jgi:hypothetical protein
MQKLCCEGAHSQSMLTLPKNTIKRSASRPLQPFQSLFVLSCLEKGFKGIYATLIVLLRVVINIEPTHTNRQKTTDLDPLLLFFSKHVLFDHPCLNRNTGQALETQPDVAVKLTFSLKPDIPSKTLEGP